MYVRYVKTSLKK